MKEFGPVEFIAIMVAVTLTVATLRLIVERFRFEWKLRHHWLCNCCLYWQEKKWKYCDNCGQKRKP